MCGSPNTSIYCSNTPKKYTFVYIHHPKNTTTNTKYTIPSTQSITNTRCAQKEGDMCGSRSSQRAGMQSLVGHTGLVRHGVLYIVCYIGDANMCQLCQYRGCRARMQSLDLDLVDTHQSCLLNLTSSLSSDMLYFPQSTYIAMMQLYRGCQYMPICQLRWNAVFGLGGTQQSTYNAPKIV